MGGLSAIDVMHQLATLGCVVRLDGEKVKVRGPNLPEVAELVSELHNRRDDAIAFLREKEDLAPDLKEVQDALPTGIKLVRYEPKQVPFAVAPVSVVTNAGKFFRAYLGDLRRRIGHPEAYATPPLTDILGKLADAGLELRLEWEPGGNGRGNGEVQLK